MVTDRRVTWVSQAAGYSRDTEWEDIRRSGCRSPVADGGEEVASDERVAAIDCSTLCS